MSDTYPTCDYCAYPAVCFGADLAHPKHRCPIHCRKHRQFGGVHGDEEYMNGHTYAEGYL